MKPTIVYKAEYHLYQWQDQDTGTTIQRKDIPPKVRTTLVLEQLRKTPEHISLLKSFMIMNRMPYHQLLKAGLTLQERHPYSKSSLQYTYRSDGLIDLYKAGKPYAIAHTTGVIVVDLTRTHTN